MSHKLRIGYVVPQFPGQTHIFFWREVRALEAMGHQVHLISTRMPPSGLIAHDWSDDAIARTTYLGDRRPLPALRALGSLLPQGLPLWKPPYSRMTAIDLNEGEHAWMRPNGDGDRYRNHPRLRDLDLPPLGDPGIIGGPLITKTLLVSALSTGGADNGPRLVARDKSTGDIVGWVDLPARAIGTPMTYMHEGVQYILLPIFGMGRDGERIPGSIAALRLP